MVTPLNRSSLPLRGSHQPKDSPPVAKATSYPDAQKVSGYFFILRTR